MSSIRKQFRFYCFVPVILLITMFIAGPVQEQTLEWAASAGCGSVDEGYTIGTAQDIGSFISGGFGKTATFGLVDANETTVSTLISSIFLAHYESNGSLAWVRHIDSLQSSGASMALATD